jgi:hypothetical protein
VYHWRTTRGKDDDDDDDDKHQITGRRRIQKLKNQKFTIKDPEIFVYYNFE